MGGTKQPKIRGREKRYRSWMPNGFGSVTAGETARIGGVRCSIRGDAASWRVKAPHDPFYFVSILRKGLRCQRVKH